MHKTREVKEARHCSFEDWPICGLECGEKPETLETWKLGLTQDKLHSAAKLYGHVCTIISLVPYLLWLQSILCEFAPLFFNYSISCIVNYAWK